MAVDEAYIEFSGDPSLSGDLAKYPHLVVLRTLSKAYGLAGARVGSLIACAEIVALLAKVIPPYSIPQLTIEAVLATLAPPQLAIQRERVAQVRVERERLRAALAGARGVHRIWPSVANFLLVDFADAGQVLAAARDAKLLIRDMRTVSPQAPAYLHRHARTERPTDPEPFMSQTKVLFVDRDGTLIEEPPDEQVDAIEKIRFMPGVFAAMRQARSWDSSSRWSRTRTGWAARAFPQKRLRRAASVHDGCLQLPGHRVRRGVRLPASQERQLRLPQAEDQARRDFVRERTSTSPRARWSAIATPTSSSPSNLGVRGIRVRRHGSAEETWPAILRTLAERKAPVQRKTKETDIDVRVNLDATSPVHIVTGIGFFDHMLEQIAKHGGFALDAATARAISTSTNTTPSRIARWPWAKPCAPRWATSVGIARYGFVLPMDEAQVRVAIDLSGRAYGVFEGKFNREAVGGLPTELVPHFFSSLAESLKAAVHVTITGENTHHMIEACFKGIGRALRQAFRREGEELPSTKGVL